MTSIEWANETWNPVTGCEKVSEGCKNCYAIGMTNRLQGIKHSKEKYAGSVEKTKGGNLNWTGQITTHPEELNTPAKWKKPRRIFVCSMSDLFHEDVPFEFILQVLSTMWLNDQHTYLILTKRPERVVEFLKSLLNNSVSTLLEFGLTLIAKELEDYTPNIFKNHIWIGTSVENQEQANKRIPHLLKIPATVRFLSCEPLLGSVDLTNIDPVSEGQSLGGINAFSGEEKCWGRSEEFSPSKGKCPQDKGVSWVIAGGESGHNARPMHPDWVRSLKNQCQEANVPFFFKQWGEWVDSQNYDWSNDQKNYQEYHFGSHYTTQTVFKVGKKAAGRLLDGREWNEMPIHNSSINIQH